MSKELKFNEIKLESSQVVMENYYDFERHAYEETCNLFKKEVK